MTSTNEADLPAFDRGVIDVLKALLPDKKMSLTDGEGNVWKSHCKDMGGLSVTTITRKNGHNGTTDLVAKVIHDFDSNEEREFIY